MDTLQRPWGPRGVSHRWPLRALAAGLLVGLLSFVALPLRADDQKVVGEETIDAGLRYIEWLLEDRVTDRGVQGSLLNAWRAAQRMPNTQSAAVWESLGPAPLVNSGGTRFSGRTNAVAIDPSDPSVIYLGAALGGVWKTTDEGQTWTPLTDDQPSLAMGAIAIDPLNPQTIYAGTGEENFSGDSYYGAGILRSEDAGATWTRLGEDVFVDRKGGGAKVSRLLSDPQATGTLYAATTWGLYKSTDRGETWALKLSSRNDAAVTDLVMHSSNSAILYAAVSVPSNATNKGLYR